MQLSEPLVDIHCHLLPDLDDGAQNWLETTQMARMAVADGIGTVVVTPHQLGVYSHNGGDQIRRRTMELQSWLREKGIPLRVVAGAHVRCEEDLLTKVRSGEVLTLADQGKHVLLELPPAPYPWLEEVLEELQAAELVGIVAHPERHGMFQRNRQRICELVDAGCLVQITADSLVGAFGYRSQELSEWMLDQRLVHFVASDAHGANSRRPLLRQAYSRVAALTDDETAAILFQRNPAAVVAGEDVLGMGLRRQVARWGNWFRWRRAA